MTFRQRLALSVAATLVLIGVCAAIITTAPAQPTLSLPFATVTTVGTTSAQIVGVNPSRRAIQICNGAGATNVAAIAPAGITPVTGATGTGVQLAIGACYTSPPVTASGSTGGAGGAWNGIGAASSQTLIVLEW